MDLSQLKVEDMNLSVRLNNVLRRAGICTFGQLQNWTEDELRDLPNMGAKSMQELKDRMEYLSSEEGKQEFCGAQPIPKEEIGDFFAWTATQEGRDFVCDRLREKQLGIDALELLPARTYNLLRLAGWKDLSQLLFATEAELLQVHRMDAEAASQTVRLCQDYLTKCESWLRQDWEQMQSPNVRQQQGQQFAADKIVWYCDPAIREQVLQFVQANDRKVEDMPFVNRIKNRLWRAGYENLSQIAFWSEKDWLSLQGVNQNALREARVQVDRYFSENRERLQTFLAGDTESLWKDENIRRKILELYCVAGFNGLSYQDFREKLPELKLISDNRMKRVIGELLAEDELEYVDFRCYRVYPPFAQILEQCDKLDERNREIVRGRLQGKTLEAIAQDMGVTRERIRQIVKSKVDIVYRWHCNQNGIQWFDEDYYRYFYENYAFDKNDAEQWLGIPVETIHYLEAIDVKQGTKDLTLALEDYKKLDVALRLKIKKYLHRNQILVDGVWINKRRGDLESIVVKKCCTENTSFDEFGEIYNNFLREHGVPEGDKLYFTPEVARSRRNHLEQSHMLLWKFRGKFRAYDVDGRDYTELWETLQLDSCENVEYSAQKFVDDYPDLMKRYDIQDGYELHNLLRKTLPEGSFHNLHFGKQPIICFGTFNRSDAVFDLLVENAPISNLDLAELVHQEYGFERETVLANMLPEFAPYYHKGMYTIDQKEMSKEHMQQLAQTLTEPFYYLGELKNIYSRLFPMADVEEINPYNLKCMGFQIFSRCALQNYPSLENYFNELLTKDDVFDCKPYRKRYGMVVSFSGKLVELRRSMELIEFAPDQYIHFRKLQSIGVTKEQIREFCDDVYDFVDQNGYFSAKSIREDGFKSELYDLEMEDWFYANLLFSDSRFSYGLMFGCPILYKGNLDITIKSFLYDKIQTARSFDILELISLLEAHYGCRKIERTDILYKLEGTGVFYDKILDRLYVNADLYYQELDQMEDI